MSATCAAAPTPASSMSIASCKPDAPSAARILESAAARRRWSEYVAEMRWMHPIYAQLRNALATGDCRRAARPGAGSTWNARVTFPRGTGRYIVVNAAAQRLFMYENGEAVDSMRVVVGKPDLSDADDERLHPLREPQSLLVRAARSRGGTDRAQRPQAGRRAISTELGYQVVSDFVEDPRSSIPR